MLNWHKLRLLIKSESPTICNYRLINDGITDSYLSLCCCCCFFQLLTSLTKLDGEFGARICHTVSPIKSPKR